MSAEDEIKITLLDPWMKKPAVNQACGRAIYVGRYELPIEMVMTITEALFLSGGPDGWDLWGVQDEDESQVDRIVEQVRTEGTRCLTKTTGGGLLVSGILESTPQEAARELFKVLMRSRLYYTMPSTPFGGGLLSVEDLSREKEDFIAMLERNEQAAEAAERANPSPINVVAMTFGLQPRPAGHHPTTWMANCPGGEHHTIMISTISNEFGCGYCRRKGGPDELILFCEEQARKVRVP